jgi:hypothetical protein
MQDDDEDYDKELEEFLSELALADRELDALSSHIDELFSWHDFLLFAHDNLLKLERNLDAIGRQAIRVSASEEQERQFLIGVLWVGAISAYEGAMHELFLQTLQVPELRERIRKVCEDKIQEDKRLRWEIKSSDIESIRKWLVKSTISDPAEAAKRFDKFYGIQTIRPARKWCKRISDVRNAFAHRNGGVAVDERELSEMVQKLKKFADGFHIAFASQVNQILAKQI